MNLDTQNIAPIFTDPTTYPMFVDSVGYDQSTATNLFFFFNQVPTYHLVELTSKCQSNVSFVTGSRPFLFAAFFFPHVDVLLSFSEGPTQEALPSTPESRAHTNLPPLVQCY